MGILLKIRRAETPFFACLKSIVKSVLSSQVPVPRFARPLLRGMYTVHLGVYLAAHWVTTYFYKAPLFRSRCEAAGKRISMSFMPWVSGHTRLYVGNDVGFNGRVDILSGRMHDTPTLRIGDRVQIGHMVAFSVNKEVVLEEGVYIASACYIADNDGHPLDPDLRARNMPPALDEIKPVRICRNAWIGHGCSIHKGVTIGEAAVIGAQSVVVTDIPPFTLAAGNPARVVMKIKTASGAT